MASKKPAKPMSGQIKQSVQDPAIYGSIVKYIGSKSTPCICAKCGKATVRGLVRTKSSKYFCSATCAYSDHVATLPSAE